MEKHKAKGSRRVPTERITRRSPELDAAVDHFLATACDRSRRYILELLAHPREDEELPDVYERRSGEIAQALGLSSSTTSEHLRQLAEAHLVVARKEGNTTYYQLSNHALVRAFQDLLRGLDTHYRKLSSSS
jgi:DNA-binding transcriptional ArsR family regulator